MKRFVIHFLDNEQNSIYTVVDTFFDERDAEHYANQKLATTSDNCVSFEIYEK